MWRDAGLHSEPHTSHFSGSPEKDRIALQLWQGKVMAFVPGPKQTEQTKKSDSRAL
jgi:hypothetical protein